ncbi:MAG TPA: hypothetical protein VJG90_01670 [Candidatus Nanoarchaeia archaeon]|nr:hypothetical protein [Candidatus Nanoarchaeia archaeon]
MKTTQPRKPFFNIACFSIGLLSFLFLAFLTESANSDAQGGIALLFGGILLAPFCLFGIAFGIIGFFLKEPKRTLGLIGLALSLLIMTYLVFFLYSMFG